MSEKQIPCQINISVCWLLNYQKKKKALFGTPIQRIVNWNILFLIAKLWTLFDSLVMIVSDLKSQTPFHAFNSLTFKYCKILYQIYISNWKLWKISKYSKVLKSQPNKFNVNKLKILAEGPKHWHHYEPMISDLFATFQEIWTELIFFEDFVQQCNPEDSMT